MKIFYKKLLVFLLCDFCFCFAAGKSKNSNKVFLCGKSLEHAYLGKLGGPRDNSNLIIKNLFDFAKNAYENPIQNINLNESMALSIVESALEHFLKRVRSKSFQLQSRVAPVLIFGGVLQGGGEFLKNLIKNKFSNFKYPKKIKVIFSEMGDERSILGAVVNGIYKLNLANAEGYAVGVDIGGTNIRVGVVNLVDFSVKNLIKIPVFESPVDKDKMLELGQRIKSSVKTLRNTRKLNRDSLIYLLKNKKLCVEHVVLFEKLIERLCHLILQVTKGLNAKFVAISSAGTFGSDGFIKYAYNLPLTCVNLKKELEKRLDLPVTVQNDMHCAALGEKLFGGLKDADEFIIAGLGTGIGLKYYKSSELLG